jgi:chorismate mutase
MNIENKKDGIFKTRSKDDLLIVAGPCSVESEEQVMLTAQGLKNSHVDIFRGGIWKPRTRPNAFEGIGGKGLAWLKKAGEALGKPVGTEVATPLHVELCLSHGIDVLWIGARTSANPFSVQAIANVLKGVDIPVLVKNPVSPDIALWIGALERLNNSGIKQLAAIHRGFSLMDSGQYRNQPNWRIPIELKRRLPELPVICDPSHICGNRTLLQAVSQEAIDLLFDGLMLEVHSDPDSALSDKDQQLTPDDFSTIMRKLKLKTESSDNTEYLKHITLSREDIDKIDSKLLELLGERMEIVEDIGAYKKKNSVTVLQPSRWNEILETRIKQGKENDLSDNFVTKVYQLIHEEAVRHQEKI